MFRHNVRGPPTNVSLTELVKADSKNATRTVCDIKVQNSFDFVTKMVPFSLVDPLRFHLFFHGSDSFTSNGDEEILILLTNKVPIPLFVVTGWNFASSTKSVTQQCLLELFIPLEYQMALTITIAHI